jgi:hypothetical protein
MTHLNQFSDISLQVALDNNNYISPMKPKVYLNIKKNHLSHQIKHFRYNDQLVNVVLGNDRCLHWESYENSKHILVKTQS